MNECLWNLRQWPEKLMSDAQTQFISLPSILNVFWTVVPHTPPSERRTAPRPEHLTKYLHTYEERLSALHEQSTTFSSVCDTRGRGTPNIF